MITSIVICIYIYIYEHTYKHYNLNKTAHAYKITELNALKTSRKKIMEQKYTGNLDKELEFNF